MGFQALHRLRRRSRGIAAATVALFALNWLGLALVPCAMASAVPAATHASMALPSADGASAPTLDDAMPPECRARMAAAATHPTTPDARQTTGPAAGDSAPCPWCQQGASAAACGATPKPALDARDAKGFPSPLLVALSATVLGFVPLDAVATAVAAADPVLPPATPAQDRYCRRLE
jgi:hypothetical protein